ncbi:tumor necrosis factor alpha-induced protein 2-like isoform X3 [Xyrauchen texanus]|uniref:tumor necrosis factor alpha-induced protein 2-like isoform X2 n=1 Tax=Xyrauchen texanus TaxID=154827 RepID=UPI00224244D5|nr:tumor necrosis factor alpha-induced protein 2-like isoform X2 [Xyrauchen texanus]XP_051955232.1 tumor necrosis factor alpha-induced protein 2-like isoform X3 [Xyrauchen texanus]
MSVRRTSKEENPESCEDIIGNEGIGAHPGDTEAESLKLKPKIKMITFMKHKKNSKSAATFNPETPIDLDFKTIEGIADSPGDPEMECQKHKHKTKISDKIKILDFMKRQMNLKSSHTVTPEAQSVDLDFNENLKQNHLAEAQQQLVAAEERLFGSNEVASAEDEDDKLQTGYEIYMIRLRMAIYDSFNKDNKETLKSALTSILQEEAQDRRWEGVAVEQCPIWRPTKCRELHDTLLKAVVEERMSNAVEQENGADKLSTSLKREVCRIGKQVQKDLLIVVRVLRVCYPPDFDICRMYSQLYHQAFSTRLQELAKSSIDFEDCLYILSWIVDYYPRDVLEHKELKEHINNSSLGPLLPEEHLKTLEEQFFSYKEHEITKWLCNALEKEVIKWNAGTEPDLTDGYYFSNLAVDVLPLVDATVRDVKSILVCESKAQNILCPLDTFLIRYMKSLEELLKTKQENIPNILSANLVSIHQFRYYVQRAENTFSEETRTACLSTLSDLKSFCHKYFLSRIHTEMKSIYRKLWTQVWFAGHDEVVEELVKALENNIDHFKEMKADCLEELLVELHKDVMVEYVRRMMKQKLKLKDKEQQEAAAEFICQDSSKICSVFPKLGSKQEWLSQILLRLAEILRLQDPMSLQLEIVTLERVYPDISEQHVLAVLNLKSNLSNSDLRRIKLCLREHRGALDTESSPSFFSKVRVKRKILQMPG